MIGIDDEVEAGVEVGAEVETVEVGMIEVEMVEPVGTLPLLLPPSSQLLPPCRASLTISAVSSLCPDGVAFR